HPGSANAQTPARRRRRRLTSGRRASASAPTARDGEQSGLAYAGGFQVRENRPRTLRGEPGNLFRFRPDRDRHTSCLLVPLPELLGYQLVMRFPGLGLVREGLGLGLARCADPAEVHSERLSRQFYGPVFVRRALGVLEPSHLCRLTSQRRSFTRPLLNIEILLS